MFLKNNYVTPGINDISKRSDLPKVLMKVEEKFRLDLSGKIRFVMSCHDVTDTVSCDAQPHVEALKCAAALLIRAVF